VGNGGGAPSVSEGKSCESAWNLKISIQAGHTQVNRAHSVIVQCKELEEEIVLGIEKGIVTGKTR